MPASTRRPTSASPRIATTLSLAATLAIAAACASTDPNAPAVDRGQVIVGQPGAEVTLAPGQTAQIPNANVQVNFKRLVSDSRCPVAAHIQCVWGGSVIVEVEGGPLVGFAYVETKRLETLPGRDTATVAGQPVRLVRVLPERTSTDSIPVGVYRIVLQVGAVR